MVSRLPFFDHVSLLALNKQGSQVESPSDWRADSSSSLRLLIAANCQNATSTGLVIALKRLPNLAFLDLSRTLAARDKSFLIGLKNLPLLQVLKLRDVHLRDEDMVYLANAISHRVRSLDVSENDLTDHSVRNLLAICFEKTDPEAASYAGQSLRTTQDAEDWPLGMVRPDSTMLDEFKDESYDRAMVRRLTRHIVSRLPSEDMPPSGITHLSIADNQISVEGLAALIRTGRLYMLDAGSPDIIKTITRPRSRSSSSPVGEFGKHLHLPGIEKLVPVFGRCGQEMTSLRIDHTIMTEIGPPDEEDLPLALCELPINEPLPELEPSSSQMAELDGGPPRYELESGEAAPRYELPGDPVQVIVSPTVGKKPGPSAEENIPQPKRGSIFAPEVAEDQRNVEDSVVLTTTGLGNLAQGMNGIPSPMVSPRGGHVDVFILGSNGDTSLSVALIKKQRAELRDQQTRKPHGLMPAMLPKLRTITLTKVPCFESSRKVTDSLIQFIQYCAREAQLATLEARLECPRTPDIHPLDSKARYERHHLKKKRETFALQRIVLEMNQIGPIDPTLLHLAPHRSSKSKTYIRTRSSTEDADSEAFWRASENDFTFFDDEEECGLPAAETSSLSPNFSHMMSEKILTSSAKSLPERPVKSKGSKPPAQTDIIQELSRFRRERKLALEAERANGLKYVDGYWPGEVKVIRGQNLGAPSSEGMVDYYGNYFEKGWVYR